MVEKIYQKLLDSEKDTYKEIADRILVKIESEGILPPKRKINMTPESKYSNYKEENSWESEDE